MSKIITSPVKRFPGTVTLSDPLTFPQAVAWEKAIRASQEAGLNVGFAEQMALALPGLLACAEAWHLANIPEIPTPENFPSTPRVAVANLLAWLMGEISAIYDLDESEDPNA